MRKVLLLVLLTLIVAGCSVQPEFTLPEKIQDFEYEEIRSQLEKQLGDEIDQMYVCSNNIFLLIESDGTFQALWRFIAPGPSAGQYYRVLDNEITPVEWELGDEYGLPMEQFLRTMADTPWELLIRALPEADLYHLSVRDYHHSLPPYAIAGEANNYSHALIIEDGQVIRQPLNHQRTERTGPALFLSYGMLHADASGVMENESGPELIILFPPRGGK